MNFSSIHYSLKLGFRPGVENPSRLFFTMGSMIDSFKSMDQMLAYSLNAKFNFGQYLENIEISSIVSFIREKLEYDGQDDLGAVPNEEQVNEYFDSSKRAIIHTINTNSNIDRIEPIVELNKNIEKIANDTGMNAALLYIPQTQLLLIKEISTLTQSTSKLQNDETFTYSKDNDALEIQKECVVNEDSLRNYLVEETIDQTIPMVLKIKKPDLIGNSKWEFKFGKRTILAKIIDQGWNDKFLKGEISFKHGFAIKALVHEILKYDINGNLIDESHEIIKVQKEFEIE